MSKKVSKRARRREQQFPTVWQAYAMAQERRGRVRTTPRMVEQQAVREPFYLQELGLEPVLRSVPVDPRYEARPIIRGTKS